MRHRSQVAASLLTVCLAAAPAGAQLVEDNSSGSATAASMFGPGGFLPPRTDAQSFGPNGGAAIGEIDYFGFGRMRAVQTGYGLNAVHVDARIADTPDFSFSARTTFDLAVRNAGSPAIPIDFAFQLNGGTLRLYDPSQTFDNVVARVGLTIFSIAPARSGFLWAWDIDLRGSNGVVTPSTSTFADPLGLGLPAISPVTIANGVASVTVAPMSFSVPFGALVPGATAFVTYDMRAGVSGSRFPWGGRAALGDPFDPSGSYGAGVALVPGVTAVPEPSAASLAALGLAALALASAARRRAADRRRVAGA